MKKIVKTMFYMLAIIFVFFLMSNKVNAEAIGNTKYLQRAEKGYYTIQKWNGSNWIYVTYSRTTYIDDNGITRIAYCVNPDLKGIGYISGEVVGYDVEIKNLLSDNKLWRALVNGYPYNSPESMGVETDDDAYLATKMAIYAIMRGNTENDIRTLYRPGKDKVEGQSLEEIERRGTKVIETICKLINIGYNGTETIQSNNILKIEKDSEFLEDSLNKNYYSQKLKIKSKVECKEYYIKNISNFPAGTIITDIDGNQKYSFEGGEEFKLMVPKTSIMENINGTIEINGICKTYPIYYSECKNGNYQNYLLCCDSFSDNFNAVNDINIEINKSSLKIVKIDKDTKRPIAGVKFSVKYKDGTNIGIYTTDENGVIYIENLHQGEIIVKELENNKFYNISKDEYIIELNYNESKNIVIENEIKKGNIKIIKVDADNNEIKIEGVKFNIFDENGNLITTVITNDKGEADICNLPINHKYIIKEVESAKDYILSEDVITVELNENEVKNIIFENKRKEKLPRTGSIDVSNYLLIISVIGIIINKKFLLK